MTTAGGNSRHDEDGWELFYKKRKDSYKPSAGLKAAIKILQTSNLPLTAVDLAAGEGSDALYLLHHGFKVTAIDHNPAARKFALKQAPAELQPQFDFITANIFQYPIPNASLSSIQFCLQYFAATVIETLISKILVALPPQGVLTCNFLGPKDEWLNEDKITCYSQPEIENFLRNFKIVQLHEKQEISDHTYGSKFWHIFEVVAVKP